MALFKPVSALSLEYIPVLWTSGLAGTACDPTGQTEGQGQLPCSFAVPQSSGNPLAPAEPATWYDGVWLTGANIAGYVQQCPVGPAGEGGEVQLTAGLSYDVWARITGSPESPVRFVGTQEVY